MYRIENTEISLFRQFLTLYTKLAASHECTRRNLWYQYMFDIFLGIQWQPV